MKTRRLSEIADVNPPLGVSLNDTDEVSFVPMAAFSEISASVVTEEVRQYGHVKKGFTSFKNGDVLFAKITPCFENGKIGLAQLSRDVGLGSTEFHVIRAKPGKADPRFLHHFLRLGTVRLSGTKRMTGSAGQRRVPKAFLESLAVPAISLGEQRRIAAILDKAEELRAKRRAAIALLNQLPQAIFLEMFGAPDQAWSVGTVSDAINRAKGSIRTGPFGSQLLHSEFTENGIAVLGIDNAVANEFRWSQRRFISARKYEQLKRYTVRPGDVLITIMGTCGRCAIVPDNIPLAINTKHLCCITLDPQKCLPEYLHANFLYHPDSASYLSQTTKGAIMEGLNMEIIKILPLRLPPVERQRQYAARVEAINFAKTIHQSALAEFDALFASLQHGAFPEVRTTGRQSVQSLE